MLEIGPGSDGLVLQPYWGPSLDRPNSRGAIIGFSEKHTRLHLYRAIIEGIAYCLREGKERIEKKEKTKVFSYSISISPFLFLISSICFLCRLALASPISSSNSINLRTSSKVV